MSHATAIASLPAAVWNLALGAWIYACPVCQWQGLQAHPEVAATHFGTAAHVANVQAHRRLYEHCTHTDCLSAFPRESQSIYKRHIAAAHDVRCRICSAVHTRYGGSSATYAVHVAGCPVPRNERRTFACTHAGCVVETDTAQNRDTHAAYPHCVSCGLLLDGRQTTPQRTNRCPDGQHQGHAELENAAQAGPAHAAAAPQKSKLAVWLQGRSEQWGKALPAAQPKVLEPVHVHPGNRHACTYAGCAKTYKNADQRDKHAKTPHCARCSQSLQKRPINNWSILELGYCVLCERHV